MEESAVTIILRQVPGTGTPSQWHCEVASTMWGAAVLQIDSYLPEVLAALRVAIDRIEGR